MEKEHTMDVRPFLVLVAAALAAAALWATTALAGRRLLVIERLLGRRARGAVRAGLGAAGP